MIVVDSGITNLSDNLLFFFLRPLELWVPAVDAFIAINGSVEVMALRGIKGFPVLVVVCYHVNLSRSPLLKQLLAAFLRRPQQSQIHVPPPISIDLNEHKKWKISNPAGRGRGSREIKHLYICQ